MLNPVLTFGLIVALRSEQGRWNSGNWCTWAKAKVNNETKMKGFIFNLTTDHWTANFSLHLSFYSIFALKRKSQIVCFASS